jgi:23S rRNA C2498 (ribose-2'-O)-methylase RlmM
MTNDSMGIPFQIVWKSTPSESESKILEATLKQWCNINDWDRRIFKTMRNVIKYGDQPFVRDPETWQLQFVDPGKVTKVVVNENEGKKPEQYIIADIDLNRSNSAQHELSA